MEFNRATGAKTTMKIHNKFSDVFTGILCFKGTFSLKIKEDTQPYQVLPRDVTYALQEPFTKSHKIYKNSRYCHQ